MRWFAVPVVLLLVAWLSPLPANAAPDEALMRERARLFVEESRGAPSIILAVSGPHGRRWVAHGDAGDGLPPDLDTWFEAGSVSKGLTGLLLAQMVSREEVRLDQPIGSLYPNTIPLPPALAAITLEELATHHSGLPRLAINLHTVGRLVRRDPYAGSSPEEILADVARQSPAAVAERRGTFGYSNLGQALLGQLLARRADRSYQDLLNERVFVPLELPPPVLDTGVISGRVAQGTSGGRPVRAWQMDAYAPAGGLQATANGLLDLGERLLAAEPTWVAEALRARRDTGGRSEIALGWIHTPIGDQRTIWHNGGTGGFRSFIAILPDSGEVVVALANGNGNVDAVVAGLFDPAIPPLPAHRPSWTKAGLTLLGLLVAPMVLLGKTPDTGTRARRTPDRLDSAALALAALMILALLRTLGDWLTLPFWLWWLAAAAVAVLLPLTLLRMRAQPWPLDRRRAWLRGGALCLTAVIVAVLW